MTRAEAFPARRRRRPVNPLMLDNLLRSPANLPRTPELLPEVAVESGSRWGTGQKAPNDRRFPGGRVDGSAQA